MTHQAVLGLGGTIDFELKWDAGVIETLAAEHGIAEVDLVPPGELDSERALVISILCHLRDGTGGEHFVASPALIQRFAERFEYRMTLGGTPVRAALALSALGFPSTVHLVSINDDVRRLLPADIDYVCSADHDSTDPHLIVQYPAQERIRLDGGDIITPAANRLIYPCDQPNRDLELSADLPIVLATARIFLISGLNSIQERGVLDERLDQLVSALKTLPEDATVVYEDAAFHNPSLSLPARAALAGQVNVYSLNEDELAAYSGRPVDLLDAHSVKAAILELHAQVPVPIVMLHTRYFAVAHGRDAQRFQDVLATGVAVAGARYAYGDGVRRSDIERLEEHRARNVDGTRVVTELLRVTGAEFAGASTLDLRDIETPTTVGLGDAFIGGAIAALLCDDPNRRG